MAQSHIRILLIWQIIINGTIKNMKNNYVRNNTYNIINISSCLLYVPDYDLFINEIWSSLREAKLVTQVSLLSQMFKVLMLYHFIEHKHSVLRQLTVNTPFLIYSYFTGTWCSTSTRSPANPAKQVWLQIPL